VANTAFSAYTKDLIKLDDAANRLGVGTVTLLNALFTPLWGLTRQNKPVFELSGFKYIKINDFDAMLSNEMSSQSSRKTLKIERDRASHVKLKLYELIGKQLEKADTKGFENMVEDIENHTRI
jgi:hypothetical protein